MEYVIKVDEDFTFDVYEDELEETDNEECSLHEEIHLKQEAEDVDIEENYFMFNGKYTNIVEIKNELQSSEDEEENEEIEILPFDSTSIEYQSNEKNIKLDTGHSDNSKVSSEQSTKNVPDTSVKSCDTSEDCQSELPTCKDINVVKLCIPSTENAKIKFDNASSKMSMPLSSNPKLKPCWKKIEFKPNRQMNYLRHNTSHSHVKDRSLTVQCNRFKKSQPLRPAMSKFRGNVWSNNYKSNCYGGYSQNSHNWQANTNALTNALLQLIGQNCQNVYNFSNNRYMDQRMSLLGYSRNNAYCQNLTLNQPRFSNSFMSNWYRGSNVWSRNCETNLSVANTQLVQPLSVQQTLANLQAYLIIRALSQSHNSYYSTCTDNVRFSTSYLHFFNSHFN